MRPGVVVCFHHDPRGCIRDTEVEDLAGGDEGVEAVHDLFDGGGEVPEVQVEEVDIRRLQVVEGFLDGEGEGFEGVADCVAGDGGGGVVGAGVFCCQSILSVYLRCS